MMEVRVVQYLYFIMKNMTQIIKKQNFDIYLEIEKSTILTKLDKMIAKESIARTQLKSILQMEMQPIYEAIVKQDSNSTQTTDRGSFITSQESSISPDNMWNLIGIMSIVGISPFYVGLTIFLSAAASIDTYKSYYHIQLESIVSFSMINGVVPFGGIVGSMTLTYLLKHTNRRDIAIFHLVLTSIFCGITLIPTFETLLVGRFLLGIICSWQNSIGAMLTRDFTPTNLRSLFGAFYYLSRVSGITMIFFIGYLVDFEPSTPVFLAINCIPIYLNVIQLILLKLFVPMSPGDLIARGENDELKNVLRILYNQDKVQTAFNNWIRQFKTPSKPFSFVHRQKNPNQKRSAEDLLKKIQSNAFIVSLKVSLLRQFCGVNYLSLYANYVFLKLGFSFYKAGPCLINVVQIIATLCGLYLNSRFNRRPLLIVGTFGIFVASLSIAICDYYQLWLGVLIGQLVFVVFAGPAVSSIAWPYPPEIIAPLNIKYTSLISWSGSTIIAIIPIMEQSFQFFFAVSGYLLITAILLLVLMPETKNKSLREVNTQFMLKAYSKI